MLRSSPAPFRRAWATPILREPPLKYLQSERPTTAAAKPPAIPIASAASAALRIALEPVAASSPSKIKAAVQDPIGTSERAGCSGAPSQVPSKALRIPTPPLPIHGSVGSPAIPSSTAPRSPASKKVAHHTPPLSRSFPPNPSEWMNTDFRKDYPSRQFGE